MLESFFDNAAGLQPATLSKKRSRNICFPVNFAKFLRTFFYRTHPAAASVQLKLNYKSDMQL